MRVCLTTLHGEVQSVDVSDSLPLADLAVLAASLFGLGDDPARLYLNGKPLNSYEGLTISGAGITAHDMVLAQQSAPPAPPASSTPPATRGSPASGPGSVPERRTSPQDASNRRSPPTSGAVPSSQQQQLLSQISSMDPEAVRALLADPARVAALAGQLQHLMGGGQRAGSGPGGLPPLAGEDAMMEADFQRRIEEEIRMRSVLENFEMAMEHTPEAFGRVTMLYIHGEVNGYPVKAFVDSGAQATILSERLAKQCGLARLIDTRFAGVARGVGTATILGVVHAAQFKVGCHSATSSSSKDEQGKDKLKPLYLMCSFTVMAGDGNGVDLLFGLDMLKRHQACIDLAANVLRIQGQEIPFLPEHEIPNHGETEGDPSSSASNKEGGSSSAHAVASGLPGGAGGTLPTSPLASFPPSALPNPVTEVGGTSTPTPVAVPAANVSRETASPRRTGGAATFAPEAVEQLMALGATREEAVQALTAAHGNVDVAANLLFQ